MSNFKVYWNLFAKSMKRFLVSLVLFFLPIRFTCMYLEIALTTLFVTVRTDDPDIDMVKFFNLVNSDYDKSLVDLPSCNICLMWGDEFMNKVMVFHNGRYTIKEVIRDDLLLLHNANSVVDSLLVNLPSLLRFKLGILSELKRAIFRDRIIDFLGSKLDINYTDE